MTLAEFSRRYLDKRDELALRKIRGEQLTSREQIVLKALNLQLEEMLPSPPPLPDDVRDVMDEVERLR